MGITVLLIGIELPHAFPRPHKGDASAAELTVIGDSISAGIDREPTRTWPSLLAESHHVQVQSISTAGARLSTALRDVQRTPLISRIVVIEIGGNDLLGATPVSAFRERLEELVSEVRMQADSVYMLELPLPPFSGAYGRVQRELAAKYSVHLIPRRSFAWILADGSATVDGLHLSEGGCKRMADLVWNCIRGHFSVEYLTYDFGPVMSRSTRCNRHIDDCRLARKPAFTATLPA